MWCIKLDCKFHRAIYITSWNGAYSLEVSPFTVLLAVLYICRFKHNTHMHIFSIHPQVKVGRPDPVLGVICGSLCIAEQAFRKRFADYQAHLER